LLQRLRAIPGVRGASLSLSGLFNGVSLDADISVEGQAVASGQRMSAICDYVGPSYFSTVGIPILAGREIGPQDEDNAPLVGVINQTLAGAYFGGTNPIGRRIRASASYGTLDFVVVGVVADSKRDDLRESTESCFYVPYFHAAPHPNFAWAVNEARIAGKAAAAVLAIRAAIKETAPSMDMPEIRVINELVNQSITIERILTRFRIPELIWVEVIGVVAHQRQTALAEPGREQVYFTDGFRGNGLDVYWAVRAKGDPAQYASVIRAEVAKFRPNLLVTEMRPMEALVKRAQAGTRFSLLLIGVFAVIAALLASVGLCGVLSNAVRRRTAEIGVRMALGATPGSVFKLVVGHGLRLSAIGLAAGMVAAFGLTRAMTSMLVGVKATDPATFMAMAGLFLIIAAIVSGLPARRAARVDPLVALRHE
jgi:hypothetical protein